MQGGTLPGTSVRGCVLGQGYPHCPATAQHKGKSEAVKCLCKDWQNWNTKAPKNWNTETQAWEIEGVLCWNWRSQMCLFTGQIRKISSYLSSQTLTFQNFLTPMSHASSSASRPPLDVFSSGESLFLLFALKGTVLFKTGECHSAL